MAGLQPVVLTNDVVTNEDGTVESTLDADVIRAEPMCTLVENVDISDLVNSHFAYRSKVPEILARAGVDGCAAEGADALALGSLTMGSPEEAIEYLSRVIEVWQRTPGAIDWLVDTVSAVRQPAATKRRQSG